MKSETKAFDTIFSHRLFTVIYELEGSGKKQLMSIIYDGFPIDIAEIHGSDQHEDFYAHIMAAMDNNANSYREDKLIGQVLETMRPDSLFEAMANITRAHAKTHYGINL